MKAPVIAPFPHGDGEISCDFLGRPAFGFPHQALNRIPVDRPEQRRSGLTRMQVIGPLQDTVHTG